MAELEEKLNAILSDPEAMGQIASIARALTGGGMPSPDPEPAPEAPPASPVVYEPVEPLQTGGEAEPGGEAPLDWSALLGALRGLSGGDTGAGSNPPSLCWETWTRPWSRRGCGSSPNTAPPMTSAPPFSPPSSPF